MAVVGTTEVKVAYEGQTATLPLVIVKGEGPTLLGRLNWSKIHYTTSPGLHSCLLSIPKLLFRKVSEASRGMRQK